MEYGKVNQKLIGILIYHWDFVASVEVCIELDLGKSELSEIHYNNIHVPEFHEKVLMKCYEIALTKKAMKKIFQTYWNLLEARERASKLRILGSKTRNTKKWNRNQLGFVLPIKNWLVASKFVLDVTSESLNYLKFITKSYISRSSMKKLMVFLQLASGASQL